MPVRRYVSLPKWRRVLYRVYRHPLYLLAVNPSLMFFLLHRLPLVGTPWAGIVRKPRWTELLNIALLDALYAALGVWIWTHWAVARPWALTYAVVIMVMATIGVILFYTQHTFEGTYYVHDAEWSFFESGTKGSMTLRLPFRWMEWALGYINFHSVHHLKPSIPLYNLPAAHRRLEQLGVPLAQCGVGALWRTFTCGLWDEDRQRMVSFSEAVRR